MPVAGSIKQKMFQKEGSRDVQRVRNLAEFVFSKI